MAQRLPQEVQKHSTKSKGIVRRTERGIIHGQKKTLAFAGLMLMLSACNTGEKENNIAKPKEIEEPEGIMEKPVHKKEAEPIDEKCLETIEKAAYIHLGDVVEDSFQEDIGCELDEEDIKWLKSIKNDLIMENTPSIALTTYYKLTIYDRDRKILDTWTVDSNYKIEADAGYGIAGEGEIEEWLEATERKHGITYKGVWSRTPGKNYLQMLDEADFMDLMEITENNFIEGIDYEIEKEDIEKLKSIRNEITFSDKKKEMDEYYYQLNVYTEARAGLYLWTVDFDGRIYSDGYEMKGKALKSWLNSIEEKSGLTKKEKREINNRKMREIFYGRI